MPGWKRDIGKRLDTSAAVNFFDGVDCATGGWVSGFATCASEQPATIKERPTMARTNVWFRMVGISIFVDTYTCK